MVRLILFRRVDGCVVGWRSWESIGRFRGSGRKVALRSLVFPATNGPPNFPLKSAISRLNALQYHQLHCLSSSIGAVYSIRRTAPPHATRAIPFSAHLQATEIVRKLVAYNCREQRRKPICSQLCKATGERCCRKLDVGYPERRNRCITLQAGDMNNTI